MVTAATTAIDESAVQAQWRSRGFSCDVWIDPAGRVWADFVHATDELVMLVSGEIELTFNGRTLRPRPGEEVLIPAGAAHTVSNIGAKANRWLYGYGRVR